MARDAKTGEVRLLFVVTCGHKDEKLATWHLLTSSHVAVASEQNCPGEEIWILVSVQQDVTGIKPESLTSSNDALLSKAALGQF